MKIKKLNIILISLILCGVAFAQPTGNKRLPNYLERSLLEKQDTTARGQYSLTAGGVVAEEYRVGPGDKFLIAIQGIEQITQQVIVDPMGFMFIPRVGAQEVKGKTLSEAILFVKRAINNYYKNVEVYVTLSEYKAMRIAVLGSVAKPSLLTLPGNSRLLDALLASKGITQSSDLRSVLIVNEAGDSAYYDVLTYLRLGQLANNPYVNDGDKIFLNVVDRTYSIYGALPFPGVYEYKQGETIAECISLAGGLFTDAQSDSIEIVSFVEQGSKQLFKFYSLQEIQSQKIKIQPFDNIYIRKNSEKFRESSITISGMIRYPGVYSIQDGETKLSALIEQAGGLLPQASLGEARVIREVSSYASDIEFKRLSNKNRDDLTDEEYDYIKARQRQIEPKAVVDFSRLVAGDTTQNIALLNGDRIIIPEQRQLVTIIGQAVFPGTVEYNSSFTYRDYIKVAGGFGWEAVEGDVRIIKSRTGEWVDADDDVVIEPGDTIWIPEETPGPKTWEIIRDTLVILGQLAAIVAASVAVAVSI